MAKGGMTLYPPQDHNRTLIDSGYVARKTTCGGSSLVSMILISEMSPAHTMIGKAASILMATALFFSVGGHLGLLQGVAWATMIHDFSRGGSLTQAVEKTFDGKHPCAMCKKIAKVKNSEASGEKAPFTVKVEKKAEVFIASNCSELPQPVSRPFSYGPAPFVSIPEHPSAPPVPVPIVA
jgi:hypothetical protein